MPTVPSYGGQQVGESSNSGARFTAPVPINDQTGRMQRQGAELANTGAALTAIGVDKQQQVNQVRLDDALNKTRAKILHDTYDQTDGYQNLKGVNAIERPDGMALADEYGGKLKSYVSTLSGSLGNDAQRAAFSHQANALMEQHRASISQYANNEYEKHALSVQEYGVKLGADEAKLNWQDPSKIKASLESVNAAVDRTGTLKGWSGNETTARIKQTTSAVHMGVLDAAMQADNPEYAIQYMERFKDDMTADDLLKVRGVINKDVHVRVADTIATTAVSTARTRATPGDFGRMLEITAKSESGNRERDGAGNLITSPAGAQGKMQVMPATARNPGYGITPARDDSDAERTRVGSELLPALVKNYAGDPSKAWAAYNWGAGNVDKAIKEHGPNWLAHAPEETRAYVAKNLAALGSGAGAAKPTLQDVHDQVRAQVAEKFGATPPAGLLKMALTGATQQFEDLAKATKAKEDEAVSTAMRELMAVNGHFSRLPYAVRSMIPPDKVDTVMAFGEKFSKGDNITNPAVYQRLSDPRVLTKLSDNEFFQLRGELSESDFKQLAGQRATAQGKPGNKLDEINMSAMNSSMHDTLASLGLDPTPKDGTPEAAQLGAVKLFIKDSLLAHQKATGKPMTDGEVESHIKGLYAKSSTFRRSILGMGAGTSEERLLTMKAGDIPDDTRAALMKDFGRAGVLAPSDADLLGAYFHLKQMPLKRPRAPDTPQSKSGIIKYNHG